MARQFFNTGFFQSIGEGEQVFTITFPTGETLVPSEVALESSTVLCIARQQDYPGIKDYAGTLDDDNFTTTGLSGVPASERIGIYNATSIEVSGSDASLESIDDDTITAVFEVIAPISGLQALLTYGASGEAEADNFAFAPRLQSADEIQFFCEQGAGANREASWQIPNRLSVGDKVQMRFVRDAGTMRAYYGSKQLKRILATSGVTDNGDGTVSGIAASGATSAALSLTGYNQINLILGQVQSEPRSDADARAVIIDWDDSDFYPDGVSGLLDSDTIGLFAATSADLEDLAGTVDPADWSTTGGLVNIYDDVWLAGSQWVLGLATSAPFQITGALTIDVSFVYDGTTGGLVSIGATGETEATNFCYLLTVDSSTVLSFFSESGAGVNAETNFSIPAALQESRIYNIRAVRTAGGEVSVELDGVALSVSSTTGTNNGTSATMTLPTGGTSGVLNIGDSCDIRYVQIRDVAL